MSDPSSYGSYDQPQPYDIDVLQSLANAYLPPCLVLDQDQELLHIYGDASPYLRPLNAGRFSANVKDLLIDELIVPVCSAVQQAFARRKNVAYKDVHFGQAENGMHSIDLRIIFVPSSNCVTVLFETHGSKDAEKRDEESIVYQAVAQYQQRILELESELQRNRLQTKAALEELKSANIQLKNANQETVAAKEALQNAHEALRVENDKQLETIADLRQKNANLSNVMKSTNVGLLFLDKALNIRGFNAAAMRDINLLDTDIGRPFYHLSHNLIYEDLLGHINRVMHQGQSIEQEVRTQSGRYLAVNTTPYFDEHGLLQGCVLSLTDVTGTRLLKTRPGGMFRELRSRLDEAFLLAKSELRLLIVDDDEFDRNHIKRLLTANKETSPVTFGIEESDSVEDAEERLETSVYDLCFIDYHLGKSTAFELLEGLNTRQPLPPVVILSSFVDDNMTEKAIQLGIFDAIDKEVMSYHLLERCIRYCLRQKQVESYLSQQLRLGFDQRSAADGSTIYHY